MYGMIKLKFGQEVRERCQVELQNLRPEKWEEICNKIKDMTEKSILLVKKRHEWWNEECDEAFRCKGEA